MGKPTQFTCNLQFFSELITTQLRDLVTASCLYFLNTIQYTGTETHSTCRLGPEWDSNHLAYLVTHTMADLDNGFALVPSYNILLNLKLKNCTPSCNLLQSAPLPMNAHFDLTNIVYYEM